MEKLKNHQLKFARTRFYHEKIRFYNASTTKLEFVQNFDVVSRLHFIIFENNNRQTHTCTIFMLQLSIYVDRE